jgi:exodeoxyribonuclease III
MLKVITLNLNGVRAAARKGLYAWLDKQNADVVCLQETKAQFEQLSDPQFCPVGYHCEYVDAVKKGYSGVAIYSKQKPVRIIREMGFETADTEGRFCQFDFDNNLSVISLYLPSGSSGDERQAVKFKFLDFMTHYLKEWRATGREYILCGDLNIVHTEKDIKNWKSNQKNSGCLPEERAWLDQLFGPLEFVDAFRVVNQEDEQYTWWSNRGQAWAKNVGWRIDYQVITPGLASAVKSAEIYKDERFSDHAPLVMTYAY